ncbi:MAG: GNAT family N-acetyltransferase [Coriobacteriia bacterium]|nr:GNAT family N-acetyltransferase [Coriobacteriia bacterium]
MVSEPLLSPAPLSVAHDLSRFDCGVSSLNDYLSRQALADQRAEKSRTYVACRGASVVGYFTLAAASVEPQEATVRLAAGQGAQTIPVVLLARLAVDLRCRRQGLGSALLVAAVTKAAFAADTIGARAVLVHAIGETARSFYVAHGFEPSPTDPLHLVLLMKDIRRTIGSAD